MKYSYRFVRDRTGRRPFSRAVGLTVLLALLIGSAVWGRQHWTMGPVDDPGFAAPHWKVGQTRPPLVGHPAPRLGLTALDGRLVELPNPTSGRPVVLFFASFT